MDASSNNQIETIVRAQRSVVRALHQSSPSWLELNVTMAQLKTLVVLTDDGPMNIGEIGDRMGVTLPTASYQVERLVRAGLVERSEDARDRRRTLVHPTSKAEDLIRSLRQGRGEQLRAWLREMRPDDLDALEQGLAALKAIVEVPDEQSAGTEELVKARNDA
jgi:DNA-binding MarR family transcriptional regulator